MAAETHDGKPPCAYDLAFQMRDRLKGLADLVELAQRHEESFGATGDGLVQLLKDAAGAAAELLETIRGEIRGRRSAKETDENNENA